MSRRDLTTTPRHYGLLESELSPTLLHSESKADRSRQAEIAKRKAASAPSGASEPAAKQQRVAAPGPAPRIVSPVPPASKEATPEVANDADSKADSFNISNEEAVRRLRVKGQPIRLFAESDRDRRMRVRALELMEARDHDGQRNDYLRTLEKLDSGLELFATNSPATPARSGTPGTPAEGAAPVEERGTVIVDLALLKTDPQKLYPHVYWALKKILREYEASMDERPESVKRSTQGKLAAATAIQSSEYLKPLFKALRKRVRLAFLDWIDKLKRMRRTLKPMYWLACPRSSTTCKCENTSKPTMPTSSCPSATQLGLSA